MSFLVVYNGQFSPLVKSINPHRDSVRPIPSSQNTDEVHEFEEALEEANQEEKLKRPNPKMDIYKKSSEKFEQERKRLYARDIMSFPVKVISQDIPALEARNMIEQHSFRHLPVINEFSVITGMISSFEVSGDLNEKKCSDIMLHEVIVCEEQTSIHEIAIILLKEKINALPIINHKKELVGIITLSDILKYVIESTPFLGRG
jgi:CBS-domain-containing membrane protein